MIINKLNSIVKYFFEFKKINLIYNINFFDYLYKFTLCIKITLNIIYKIIILQRKL